ncbi:hypothetical protein, partial [Burkholderia ubonensis]|uniref:hypothetical protein n=1 Tax=Burkholderia ubonensis TaxID=101571 RepID=UPI001E473302
MRSPERSVGAALRGRLAGHFTQETAIRNMDARVCADAVLPVLVTGGNRMQERSNGPAVDALSFVLNRLATSRLVRLAIGTHARFQAHPGILGAKGKP